VRAYHAAEKEKRDKTARLEVGKKYLLPWSREVPWVTLTGKINKFSWRGFYNGQTYKITPKVAYALVPA
jgi:hypothetical protein